LTAVDDVSVTGGLRRLSACKPINTLLFKSYCCGSPIHAASVYFNPMLTPLAAKQHAGLFNLE
jgi:hypothetical protein